MIARGPDNILRLAALTGAFNGPSWFAWKVALRALFGLPLDKEALAVFSTLTGRSIAPSTPARELWCVCGRRAGKSAVAALVAVFLTTCRTYRLAPGERGVFMIIAADRRQARVVRRYVGGLLASTPVLQLLVTRESQDAIELSNGIAIEIHTASFRTIRGYTVVGAVCDEIAFWPTEDAADPDREILAALRPAMATVPDAMLVCLSSPYAKKGELFRAHRDHYGRDGDSVLVLQAATRQLNPCVPDEVITRAFADDPASAGSEYGALFRTDIEAFISQEAIDGCVVHGRLELPPVQGLRYCAFLDFSGGSGQDSSTLAIAHTEKRGGRQVAILDLVREVRPPFSPERVCSDFAATLKSYRISQAVADRYAGDFPSEQMRNQGVTLEPSDRAKSDLYRELLPALNSGSIELLDLPRLCAQLAGLERRTARGGRDNIDHAVGNHDDVANAVAGVLVAAVAPKRAQRLTWGRSNSDYDWQ